MTKLQSLLAAARADHRITDQEWTGVLAPVVKALPHRASKDMRALLDVWANPAIALEGAAKWGLIGSLQDAGYPLHRNLERSASAKQEAIAANIGEADVDFNRVARLAGCTRGAMLVGVIDSGTELSHDELQGKLWTHRGRSKDVHGWDFVDGDADTSNGRPHGTYTVGAATRNGKRVKAIAARVDSWKRPDDIPNAIDYEVARGARIISISQYTVNHSESSDHPDKVQRTLAAIAKHPDVLFLYAAGNRGWSSGEEGMPLGADTLAPDNFLPSHLLPNLAVVAAAEDDGSPAGYSNYGLPYATFAEYANIYTSAPGNTYKDLRPGGTSLATPQAANVAAKALLLDPDLTPSALKRLLADTADERADWTKLAAAGVLNAARAYRLAALSGLIRRGVLPEAAADQLELKATERTRLLRLAQWYS